MSEAEAKTVSERFDAIQAAVREVNIMLAEDRTPHICQVWANATNTAGKESQLISEEPFTAERFIYTDKGNINNLAVVMKPVPDANGKMAGDEVLLSNRDLEDCFPELHTAIAVKLQVHGYKDFKSFCGEVHLLVGGRREFARALSEMSHQTLAAAREAAVAKEKNEKEGFYEGRKGFGLF